MELHELLKYFRESDTIGENPEAISLMRYYSRQAHSTRTHNIRPPHIADHPGPINLWAAQNGLEVSRFRPFYVKA